MRPCGNLPAAIYLIVFLLFSALCSQPIRAQQPDDLTARSIEDLMNIQVTSVSKKEEKLARSAAAVYVITQTDIRNSGATNIPDLLRMVPGIYVAQINANTWAITARGFNDRFSNEFWFCSMAEAFIRPLLAACSGTCSISRWKIFSALK